MRVPPCLPLPPPGVSVQLILSGDFHQLPPVGKGREGAAARRFCFEADAWGRCVQQSCFLSKVFRQVGCCRALGCSVRLLRRRNARVGRPGG